MIKGVNRQMIEVTDTGSPYFERALLVVRPDCVDQQDSRLHEEAHKFLASAGTYTGLRLSKRTRRLRGIAFGICSGAAGIVVGIFFQVLIFKA